MASVSAPAGRRPRVLLAAVAVLCLALWPVEIHTAFGLPAHPLILHVPVVFGLPLSIQAAWRYVCPGKISIALCGASSGAISAITTSTPM